MSDRHPIAGTPPSATQPAPLSAGMQLQLAREDAGLTLDAVAAQLKLAPRQVQAIENDDFALLPGRTFVRGFVRNYARLLQLDADVIVAALPGASASSLDSPALNPTAQTMGELPQLAARGRAGWARWMIPLTLIAIVAAAAMYEFSRTHDGPAFSMFRRDANQQAANETNASMTGAPSALGAAPNSTTTQTLPNPLAGKEGTAETLTTPGAGIAPGQTSPTPSPATSAPGATAAPAEAETTLSLTFNDKSWTTVKDREGRVLLSKLIPGGQEQTLSGVPPFDLVIGNATEVNVKYRGENIDLSPYIRSGVARLTLR